MLDNCVRKMISFNLKKMPPSVREHADLAAVDTYTTQGSTSAGRFVHPYPPLIIMGSASAGRFVHPYPPLAVPV